MFTRNTDQSGYPVPQAAQAPQEQKRDSRLSSFGMPQAADPMKAPFSVIGNDLTIIGQDLTIICQSSLQIEGNIRGHVHAVELVIGEQAHVDGTVTADTVSVRGQVRGAIRGRQVFVESHADVDAEIVHETLAVDRGARLSGSIRRAKNPSEVAPSLDASKIKTGQV